MNWIFAATEAAEKVSDAAHEVAADAAHGAAEASEGIGALGLDPIQIAAQAATFLVLFWVIKKYALQSIVDKLDKRREDINRGLHLTGEMDQMKADLDSRVESVLKQARKDADGVIAEAHTESGVIIKAAEESANNKADGILRAAEGKIEREISQARKELKGEMASLVTEATEAVLGEKLDVGRDRKLVEDYLKEAMK